MTGWDYFAVCLERESSFERPSTIARRRPGASDADAEHLDADGRWRHTDAFTHHNEGFTDAELVPIDHARARELAAGALADGLLPHLPDDLE